jgi:hypothetical protein
LFICKGEQYQYLLVLKEDLTNYVRLVNARSADHYVVADALLEWYSMFGFPETYVSDQGSHFRKQVLKELERLTGSTHNYVTSYAPWANGTVEVVNSSILKCIRSLLSEFHLPWNKWSDLTPLIQGVLNHSPRRSLGDLSPVQLFIGLPRQDPFRYLYLDETFRKTRMTKEELTNLHAELAQSLNDLHKIVIPIKEKKRQQSRKTARGIPVNFEEGDYVLWASPITHLPKLAHRWLGPFRVIGTVSDLVFQLENMVTKQKIVAHASRICLYAEKELGLEIDVSQLPESRFEVEEFLDESDQKILVKWKGIEDIESSWEPTEILKQDLGDSFEILMKDMKLKKST